MWEHFVYENSFPDIACNISLNIIEVIQSTSACPLNGHITVVVSTNGCAGATQLRFSARASYQVNSQGENILYPPSYITVNDGDTIKFNGLYADTYTIDLELDPYCLRSGCSATQEVTVPGMACELVPTIVMVPAEPSSSCGNGGIQVSATLNACYFSVHLYDMDTMLLSGGSSLFLSGESTLFSNLTEGAYLVRIEAWPLSNCEYWQTVTVTCSGVPIGNAAIHMHVFLEGPYNPATGLMSDGLRSGDHLPSTEPYTGLGYPHTNGGGGETIDAGVLDITGNNAIVDWVVLELRDANNAQVRLFSRSALLQCDGDVVDMDGVSPVSFNAPPADYFVAVRHRNHLGAMTAAVVTLSAATASVDMTSVSTGTFGSGARKNIAGAYPTLALWAGDVNASGVMSYIGLANDRDPILSAIGGSVPTNVATGYHGSDVNLDGSVRYLGADNDRDLILNNIGGSTPTNTRSAQLP